MAKSSYSTVPSHPATAFSVAGELAHTSDSSAEPPSVGLLENKGKDQAENK